VALKPKPAFKALFQIATTKEGSGIVLYNEKTLAMSESLDGSCFWWRRGRVEGFLFKTGGGGTIAWWIAGVLLRSSEISLNYRLLNTNAG
jgi:hypothetical protein